MLPYLILLFGALCWLVAGVAYSLSPLALIGLLVLAGGFAGAAWGVRQEAPRTIAASFAVGFVGMLLFLGPDIGGIGGPGSFASHLFTLAVGVVALAALREAPALARVGWGMAALAALLWVYADLDLLAWQPGNLSALVGASWLAVSPPD